MKNIFFKALAAMTAMTMAAFMTSCDDNDDPDNLVCWDIAGTGFTIDIVDAEGKTLLDTARTDNVIHDDMYVVLDGKEFHLSDSIYRDLLDHYDLFLEGFDTETKSRALLVRFYGLQLFPLPEWDNEHMGASQPTSRCMMRFGDFSGDSNYDRTMKFVWPEQNVTHTLRVTNRIEWKKGEPDIDRHYYFDGKEIDRPYADRPIVITRP